MPGPMQGPGETLGNKIVGHLHPKGVRAPKTGGPAAIRGFIFVKGLGMESKASGQIGRKRL